MELTLVEPSEQEQKIIGDYSPAAERTRGRSAEGTVLEFGRFQVLLRQRQLLADGAPIELGTRAFEVLMALIDADGSLVTKDELLTRVWSGIVVAPDNLKVQICAVRGALGEDRDFIRTEAGRGYRFTATVRRLIATDPRPPSAVDAMAARAWGEAALPMELAAIAQRLAELEEKLAAVVQMLKGRAQHEEARLRRHDYCSRAVDHGNWQKHARQRRRA